MSVLSAAEDLEARLAAIELESRLNKEETRLEISRLVASEQAINAELAILRASNPEYAKILRRSIVADVHNYLQTAAGPRRTVGDGFEHWDAYVLRLIEERGPKWFKDKLAFPITCAGLLSKGPETAFDDGCKAAHQLRARKPEVFRATYLAGLPDEARSEWEALLEFLVTKESQGARS
ncbi:hypothetical protein Agub_g6408 [Astrephomene gubernaculifera]|uniref:Uncharacterized protein n=1 Tax=Astrephomene gubernaculifera TaxID=47775 RepID=A0AAD3DQU5_9CHLO|nr:hypothetical protein Agub_g6408 [Astrephomene gubernaculifera]